MDTIQFAVAADLYEREMYAAVTARLIIRLGVTSQAGPASIRRPVGDVLLLNGPRTPGR
jgi:hypothetical protein